MVSIRAQGEEDCLLRASTFQGASPLVLPEHEIRFSPGSLWIAMPLLFA